MQYNTEKDNTSFHRTAIFDVDDVIWGFNQAICDATGINMEDIVCYNFNNNPVLNADEKQMLKESYGSASFFRNMGPYLYPSFYRIPALQDGGVDVCFDSHCGTNEIAGLKKFFLMSKGIREDHIHMTVVDINQHHPKVVDETVDFFVDDNWDHINGSMAGINLIPLKPWNRSFVRGQNRYGKTVIPCAGLSEVIDQILFYCRRPA